MSEKKKLALFDLDGTLFDTSEVNYYAYKDALQKFGCNLDKEYFVTKCNGRHYTEFLPVIMGDDKNIDDVHKLKKYTYKDNLKKARVNEPLFDIAKGLSDSYHLAIVTTASRQNTMDILSYFGYQDFFEYMVTQENITRVKPDPQGFELAMEYFGIAPKDTIIFEDADVGVEAAKASGASVFVVDNFC